ncbi:ABC transporter substrate-binding protein [Mycobacterium sp.]|uniref:ABC transporter substrate-binding protein n=1 Tax=Mycobacterium sp. TaxID=1785 RepID=UPI00128181EC|nr:ABC transporter substrate-binding protein [Mycobacterium sp.]KAA8969654.1 MAG: ABC transporter substrate-binding protein [Mycobacterium sp.]
MRATDRAPGRQSRRGFLGAAALLAAGIPACAAHRPAPGNPGGGPVTVRSIFGATTIPAPPKRVVSAGYTEQDDLLAVGVVPIAVTAWFGDEPFAVWPWAQSRLGDAKPVVLSLDNGIQVDRIAGLQPDLIVATNAGVDADTYQKLSAIAPTVAQSDGDAFFEPWKVQADVIGEAVFQAAQMKSLIESIDQKFATVAQQYPQFRGKKVLLLQGKFYRDNVVATTGWRTEFLTQMGLVVADSVTSFAIDQQRAVISRSHLRSVLQAADVLVWTTDNDDDREALLAEPEVAAVQARSVFTTKELAGAIAFASPLSYPVVADQLPALLATALG